MNQESKDTLQKKQDLYENTDNLMHFLIADIDNKEIFYHEAIWVMENGLIPKDKLVAHIDGNPGNNKLYNLKLVDENLNFGDLHKKENKVFHEEFYNKEFVQTHFLDIFNSIQVRSLEIKDMTESLD